LGDVATSNAQLKKDLTGSSTLTSSEQQYITDLSNSGRVMLGQYTSKQWVKMGQEECTGFRNLGVKQFFADNENSTWLDIAPDAISDFCPSFVDSYMAWDSSQ
jgi:hypothetical protein